VIYNIIMQEARSVLVETSLVCLPFAVRGVDTPSNCGRIAKRLGNQGEDLLEMYVSFTLVVVPIYGG